MAKTKSRKKSTKKFNFFRNRSKFQVLAFLIVFGLVGSFFVVRTFAATPQENIGRCGQKTCPPYVYYPVEPKVAFWINAVRQSSGAQPSYLPLNECLSSYARGWAAHIAANHQFNSDGNPLGYHSSRETLLSLSRCQSGTYSGTAELVHVVRCKDDTDQQRNDCAWYTVAAPCLRNARGQPTSSSWLHDCEPGEPHAQGLLDSLATAQGVGVYFDKPQGFMYLVAEISGWH